MNFYLEYIHSGLFEINFLTKFRTNKLYKIPPGKSRYNYKYISPSSQEFHLKISYSDWSYLKFTNLNSRFKGVINNNNKKSSFVNGLFISLSKLANEKLILKCA